MELYHLIDQVLGVDARVWFSPIKRGDVDFVDCVNDQTGLDLLLAGKLVVPKARPSVYHVPIPPELWYAR